MIPVPHDAIRIDFDEGFASLRMNDVPVADAHDLLNNLTGGQGFTGMGLMIPPVAPVPAKVSFDIEWSGITESAEIVNEMQTFRGNFVKTGATISWSASDANGFEFQSEKPNPARNLYSVIGHEQNGVFFHT